MIRLTVVDNVSNTNTASINVTVDNTLPEIDIIEPAKNSTRFVDNIVRGTITDTNIQSAKLIVSNDTHTLGSYDLVISNNMFTRRVEYSPDQNNTLNLIATDKDTTDQMPSDEQTGLPGFCVLTGLLVIMMMAWLLRKK